MKNEELEHQTAKLFQSADPRFVKKSKTLRSKIKLFYNTGYAIQTYIDCAQSPLTYRTFRSFIVYWRSENRGSLDPVSTETITNGYFYKRCLECYFFITQINSKPHHFCGNTLTWICLKTLQLYCSYLSYFTKQMSLASLCIYVSIETSEKEQQVCEALPLLRCQKEYLLSVFASIWVSGNGGL